MQVLPVLLVSGDKLKVYLSVMVVSNLKWKFLGEFLHVVQYIIISVMIDNF